MKDLRIMKAVLVITLSLFALPMMAQTNKGPQVVKETSKAKVVVENGKSKLVLKSGREKGNIEIFVENNTWQVLDSLVSAPHGSPIHIKDVCGYNINVQRANVSSNNGLFFTSGSRFVAITEEELRKIKL